MPQKKMIIGVASFFLAFTLLIGYYAVAAEVGGFDNPLVTIGYLNDLDLNAMAKDAMDTYMSEFYDDIDSKLADAYNRINEMGGTAGQQDILENQALLDEIVRLVGERYGGSGDTGGGDADYKRVHIPAGKTLSLPMGSSVFLRIGSAQCVAVGNPGLIDVTEPGEIANGAAIVKNHVYVVTVEAGRGVKNVGTEEAIVFVQGKYTIE